MPSGPSAIPPRVTRGAAVPDRPTVSIIILVMDETARLMTCLQSIRQATDPGITAEIIVLANGTPAAQLMPLQQADDIVLLRADVNHGFGGGCNWAARWARGEQLVFLNDDTVVQTGWLDALQATMDSDPRIAVAGSRVILSDGRLQEAGNIVWSDASISHVGRGEDPRRTPSGGPRDVDYVSFCSAMVRATAWRVAGGFDERYFPAYYEDADLCFSLRSLGWRIVCAPDSVVVHEESASTTLPYRLFLSHRNQHIFAEKWAHTLAQREPRPSRQDRAAAIGRSLATLSVAAARGDPRWRSGALSPTPAPAHRDPTIDEAEVLSTEVRHLRAHLAVLQAYVGEVRSTSSALEVAMAASQLWSAVLRPISARLRRHPRLRRLVHRLARADQAER